MSRSRENEKKKLEILHDRSSAIKWIRWKKLQERENICKKLSKNPERKKQKREK